MLVNIIVTALIIIWSVFVVLSLLKTWQKAKKQGIPSSCAGCDALGSDRCSRSCSKIDIDKIIENAKKNLKEGKK